MKRKLRPLTNVALQQVDKASFARDDRVCRIGSKKRREKQPCHPIIPKIYDF